MEGGGECGGPLAVMVIDIDMNIMILLLPRSYSRLTYIPARARRTYVLAYGPSVAIVSERKYVWLHGYLRLTRRNSPLRDEFYLFSSCTV